MRAASIGLVALFAGLFVYQAGMFPALRSAPPPPAPRSADGNAVASTTALEGFDRERQPYSIAASDMAQDPVQTHLVHLTTIDGQFKRSKGDILDLKAKTGIYDTKLKHMDLSGGVELMSQGRWTAVMEKAEVLVEEKKLRSVSPVEVDFGAGNIAANGLEISNGGKKVLFFNGVKARFSPANRKDDPLK